MWKNVTDTNYTRVHFFYFTPADNSDLHFKISPNGLGGSNLTDHGFCFLWAAARATWGVKTGKYCFEMRVEENLTVDMPETEEHPHAIRCVYVCVREREREK